VDQLEILARAAITRSYSPYSGFAVAAAVRDDSGNIHTGVNVENASYGLTQCAERTAICSAVAAGARAIESIVIYTPTQTPCTPCGACRQVIKEFAENVSIHCVCDSDERLELGLEELLPHAFELTGNKA
jgi:cytidine deaminase